MADRESGLSIRNPPSSLRHHPSAITMTILHIITRLILGGAQQNTILTCAAQAAAGHRVALAFGPIYGPEGSLLHEARQTGAELVELKWMRRSILPIHDALAYWELRRLIRRLHPDVIHTHSSKAGILGRAAGYTPLLSESPSEGAGINAPIVIHTVHGLPFHERQPRWVHDAYVALEKWAAKRCDHLIAITPAMVQAFVDNDIARREQFTIIPSGVDLAPFKDGEEGRRRARQMLGVAPGDPVVGIVARLDPLKGHDDLLDIMPSLIDRLPDLKMIFIGDGANRQHLQQRVECEGLADRVMMTGLLGHDRVAQALPALDIKALPSYQEGQSRTLIEALLCGCGIAAYSAGGIGSICIDGQTGRLVPVGDKRALADAIVWMFEHPDQRAAMIARGQALVRNQFDAARMVAMIDETYQRVLDEKKSREGREGAKNKAKDIATEEHGGTRI